MRKTKRNLDLHAVAQKIFVLQIISTNIFRDSLISLGSMKYIEYIVKVIRNLMYIVIPQIGISQFTDRSLQVT